MDKTEKIVQYIEESRAMGLRVEPPDVNRCRTQFTVDGGAIRFGLGAVKNVGGAAIDGIVRERQGSGTFTSLDDFCARVDLRLVNRRVIESLIKAGAFDSLEQTRAGLLSELDQALEAGQRRQRDREEGQVSLFDVGPSVGGASGTATRKRSAAVPEWSPDEMLGYEKEVLGFYLSGHPLEQYRDVARRLGAATAAEVAGRPVGARVLLLGQISAFTENATKSGNRMAFATLDLIDGSVPLTIFPEPYRGCAVTLRRRGPVVVRGRTDDSDKGRVILAEEVRALEDALGGGDSESGGEALACRIRVRARGSDVDQLFASVQAVCLEHRGRTPVFVHVLLPEQEVVIRVTGIAVEPDAALQAKVEGLLGQGGILVEYAGRA
jgi:DNA polymerase-3 subunit alpha